MSSLAVGGVAPPLDAEQTAGIQRAVAALSPTQLHWVSGYVAGLAAANQPPEMLPQVAADPGNTLTVLFGSQTGNGQEIATRLADRAREQGFAINLKSLADFKAAGLKRESLAVFVISTHGEGDPPDDAELFHEYILSAKAARLPDLKYAVLALGDSSYINYCQTGRELDERLAELGGERIQPLVECDLDFEKAANTWQTDVLTRLPDLLKATAVVQQLHPVTATSEHNRNNPFAAEVLVNQKITGARSSKDVRHIELSLQDSGLTYKPGDALAVVANNPPQLVEQLLQELDLDPATTVSGEHEPTNLFDALTSQLEITTPTLGFVRAWAEFSNSTALQALLLDESQQALGDFIATHQVIDIVRIFPASVTADEFAASLRKLSPRSYSIASSLAANPDEVHLTVAAVRYDAFGSEHWGAASTYLADRIDEGESVSVYIESNPRFALPADEKPIIMIGAGTGVAPYRAFVEERRERGASGENWLIFGDRNFSSDFLYQLEWQRHLKSGNLHRLDVAFSRDQQEKVYVQHRIRENAAELYAWLERGAHVYVCGDAKQMAGDVDDALIDVVATQAGVDRDTAESRLKELRRSGRYQRDVY